MRISDWSSDVCSSDLLLRRLGCADEVAQQAHRRAALHGLASLVDLAPPATTALAGDLRLVQRYQLRLLGSSLRVGDTTISGRPSCLHDSQLPPLRLLPLPGPVQQLLLRPERHDPPRGARNHVVWGK